MISWRKLRLYNLDNQEVDVESPEGRAALREYRDTLGAMDYYLADDDGEVNWYTGPAPDKIDWTGLDEEEG